MKRILFTLLAAFTLGALTFSCDRETPVEGTHVEILNQTIAWDEWQSSPDDGYFYATFRWEAINSNVLRYGNVNGYVFEGERQCPMPYVYPLAYTDADGSQFVVPEQLRFDYEEGYITVIMQDLDGVMPEGLEHTAPIKFRFVATVPHTYWVD